MKVTRTVQLHFPLSRVDEPIVTRLVTEFDLEPNLLRANVDAVTGGWMVIGLSGEAEDIDRALEWVQSYGVQVTAAE